MAVSGGFYNSVNSDRRYDANQMSSLFDGLINDGVFMTFGGAFNVTAGTGLSVNIASGRAWFNHTWTYNDSTLILTHDIPDALLGRIDAIVLEVDASEEVRANSIKIVKGIAATSPARPTLTNTVNVHQYPLAYVSIPVGLTQVATIHITNMVGTSSCPFVTGVVSSMNIDALIAQWDAEFDAWMSELEDQLSGDVAGNLQLQINDLVAADEVLDARIDDIVADGVAAGSGWVTTPDNWVNAYFPPEQLGVQELTCPLIEGDGLKWAPGTKIRYIQEKTLAAYFPFDGNALPAVGNFTINNIGTPGYSDIESVVNETTVVHHAIRFSGAQGLDVTGILTPFMPTGDFSISFMLYNTSFNGGIFQSGFGDSRYGFSIRINALDLTFRIGNGSTSYSLARTLSPNGDHFQHVVCTFRKGTMKIYIDNVCMGSRETGATIAYSPTDHFVRIGCMINSSYTSENFLTGYMDELIFINGAAIDEATIDSMYDKWYFTPFGNGPINVQKFAMLNGKPSDKGKILLYGGKDYNLETNGIAVSKLWYSTAHTPEGFPFDPDKWSVSFSDSTRRVQSNPVNGTWYTLETFNWTASPNPPFSKVVIDLIVSVAGASSGTEVTVGVFDSEGGTMLKGQTIFFPLASYRFPVHLEIPFIQVLPPVIQARVTNANVTSLALENAISAFNAKAVCAYL